MGEPHPNIEMGPNGDPASGDPALAAARSREPSSTDLPRGGVPAPWRRLAFWISAAVLASSAALVVLVMAARPSLPRGGVVGLAGSIGALLAGVVLASLARPAASPQLVLHARRLLGPLAHVVLAGSVACVELRLAVAGRLPLPQLAFGAIFTATFCALLVGLLRVRRALAAPGAALPQSLAGHHGLWLASIGALLYLPALGAFGLIDPWEPQYGEVAREMISRGDWISLWWGHEGWFMSKPILAFWAQGLSFLAFGVRTAADGMLAGFAAGVAPAPEWAARLPFVLFALFGQHVLYVGARAYVGRRAAFLGGLVLCTCPHWYFLAHQSMVDMLYAAPVCAAAGFSLLGLRADPSAPASTYRVHVRGWSFTVSGHHLLIAAILAFALPQIFYLLSRNVSWLWQEGFRLGLQPDQLSAGSPGNCGLPGQPACGARALSPHAHWQPAFSALLWFSALVALLVREARHVGQQRLYYLAAWFFTALAFMGKGAPGPVLIVATFVAFAAARGRFPELWRCRPLSGALLLACVAAPWFVQAYVRLGDAFFERLFIYDMVQRAFDHVHDTNKGDDVSFRYYVWQLGYGLFPWTGLVAAGTLYGLGRAARGPGAPAASAWSEGHGELCWYLVLYQLAAFGMFSISGTKFHHYILPLVPAAAMLCGVLLDVVLPRSLLPESARERARAPAAGLALGALWSASVGLLFVGLQCFFEGGWDGDRAVAARPLLGAGLTLGGFLLAVVASRRTAAAHGEPARSGPLGPVTAIAFLCAAVLVGLAGRDLATAAPGDVFGPQRLLNLFSYNYSRSWPDTLDFRAPLAAITMLAVFGSGAMLVPRWRSSAVWAAAALGVLSCGYCLDVYFVRVSPHWSQRGTISEYYRQRSGPDELLVAYQMRWMGENFYTGNHLAIFVSAGRPFTRWIQEQRDQGRRVLFVTVEHAKLASLQRELGPVERFELLTSEDQNDKFTLARVTL